MRILIIRHAEPNYGIDSLTGRGWKEAEYLSEWLGKMPIKACYVSPLGRAQDTASFTLEKLDQRAKVLDWLREFPPRIMKPGYDHLGVTWDWYPKEWTAVPEFYEEDQWTKVPVMEAGGVDEAWTRVKTGVDELLAEYGYVHDGHIFRAEHANNDAIALFCHFGVETVILSYLLGVSPMPLWHGTCALPSSVTTIVTEEREKGIASFRMLAFGETTHLAMHGMEPSFMARFCECYDNMNERH